MAAKRNFAKSATGDYGALAVRLRRGARDVQARMMRAVLDAERLEDIEHRVHQEMQEFFSEATKAAATAIGRLTEQQADAVERHVAIEVTDFFLQCSRRAGNLGRRLRLGETNPVEAEAELKEVLRGFADHLSTAARKAAPTVFPSR